MPLLRGDTEDRSGNLRRNCSHGSGEASSDRRPGRRLTFPGAEAWQPTGPTPGAEETAGNSSSRSSLKPKSRTARCWKKSLTSFSSAPKRTPTPSRPHAISTCNRLKSGRSLREPPSQVLRSEEHTSELQSLRHL